MIRKSNITKSFIPTMPHLSSWKSIRWWFTRYIRCFGFKRIFVPMIKKEFPKINVRDIFSVQPMTAPTNVKFVLKYKIVSNYKTGKIHLKPWMLTSIIRSTK
jgi:hypothetical protein